MGPFRAHVCTAPDIVIIMQSELYFWFVLISLANTHWALALDDVMTSIGSHLTAE